MNKASTLDTTPSNSGTDAEASRIVAEIGIPPCPAVLTAVLRESRKDEPDFAAIGKLISSDLGLAAALLKTVNSPFYGLASKVSSVQQALVFLGVANAVRLVTGLLLQQVFPVYRNPVMTYLWESSSRMAAGASYLARTLRCADRDEAYTFGLFRDCGMLLMAKKHADYADLMEASGFPHPGSLIGVEAARYVTDHARVGFHMASSWYLPQELCQAVRHHHDLDFVLSQEAGASRKARVLAAIGIFVDRVDRDSRAEPQDEEWNSAGDAALACLGLGEDDVPEMAARVREAQAEQSAEPQ